MQIFAESEQRVKNCKNVYFCEVKYDWKKTRKKNLKFHKNC